MWTTKPWGPQLRYFHYDSTYVPMCPCAHRIPRLHFYEDYSTNRNEMTQGDLEPMFSNLYPNTFGPAGIMESEVRRIIQKPNGNLIQLISQTRQRHGNRQRV